MIVDIIDLFQRDYMASVSQKTKQSVKSVKFQVCLVSYPTKFFI